MKANRRSIVPALFLWAILSGAAQGQQELVVNPAAPAHPFPHFWEQMFGSGRAVLSLRASYRGDLDDVKLITGFKYVRFHAIFHDEAYPKRLPNASRYPILTPACES